MCIATEGSSGNLGDPAISTVEQSRRRGWPRKEASGPCGMRRAAAGSEAPTQPWYRQTQGNEVLAGGVDRKS